MASFDIIQAAGSAYKLIWEERKYIFRLMLIPCLIKFVCFGLLVVLEWQQNFARQALVMLPSFFVDGWALSHLARLVLLDQRWPFRPTGNTDNDMRVLQDRAAGIMGGTLMFVVVKFLAVGVTGLMYQAALRTKGMENAEIELGMFFIALSTLVFFFWAFRLLWLYIPAAVNYPLRRFFIELGGYGASWHLIGVWLLCFIPSFLVFGKLFELLVVTIETQGGTPTTVLAAITVHMIMDSLVAVLATAGMAFGFKNYVFGKIRRKR